VTTFTAADESCPGCGQIEGVEQTTATNRVAVWKCTHCGTCWAISAGDHCYQWSLPRMAAPGRARIAKQSSLSPTLPRSPAACPAQMTLGRCELDRDQTGLPQSRFDDLYTVVYALIDDAKTRHRVIKLYKGSHGSSDPHPVVLDYGQFFAAHRRGVLGYACDRARPAGADGYRVADLDEFDRCANPRVPTRAVFELLARTGRRDGETDDEYLTYMATRRHRLGAYRGGSSGLDDESRAFAAAYFQQLGIAAGPGEVLIFCGGFKGALIPACASVMSVRRHDELHHIGGRVLAPVGFYQSLRLIPAIFGGGLDVVTDLDRATVSEWLAGTHGCGGRIVYVPLVNNADGRVLNRDRAASIAAVVLHHNQRRPGEPVWVVADDVYAGSYLSAGLTPQPIGALPGMGGWTVTVMSPSKSLLVNGHAACRSC
jgi:hypothetical protein